MNVRPLPAPMFSVPPLFTVADIHEMRIYVRVPESYSADLKNGMKAKVYVPEYPDRVFEATIATTSHAVDAKSRSLLVELQCGNSDGALTPGSFAQVHFELSPNSKAMSLSADALLFRNKSVLVATLTPDDRVHLNEVRITRDYGSSVEIAGGLPTDARVIDSPPESIGEGDQVRVAETPANGSANPRAQPSDSEAQSAREQSE